MKATRPRRGRVAVFVRGVFVGGDLARRDFAHVRPSRALSHAGSWPLVIALALALALSLSACGGNSGKVLERLDAATPPGSNMRLDLFLPRVVSSCAVGPACASTSASDCFHVTDGSGTQKLYAFESVRFLRPSDPALATGERPQCFRLVLTDTQLADTKAAADALRTDVFRASGGDLNIDIHAHEIASVESELFRFHNGFILPPSAASTFGLSLVSRDTDFTYVATGVDDPDMGTKVRQDSCAGTTEPGRGVGGASNSWISASTGCLNRAPFLSTFAFQFHTALQDIMKLPDVYRGNYPACGEGDPDTTKWVPDEPDCTKDPDWTGCGQSSCPDLRAYYRHIVSAHWPRGQRFEGNHCNNAAMDYDESGVDTGGICDRVF